MLAYLQVPNNSGGRAVTLRVGALFELTRDLSCCDVTGSIRLVVFMSGESTMTNPMSWPAAHAQPQRAQETMTGPSNNGWGVR
jgi:hypothetical protein